MYDANIIELLLSPAGVKSRGFLTPRAVITYSKARIQAAIVRSVPAGAGRDRDLGDGALAGACHLQSVHHHHACSIQQEKIKVNIIYQTAGEIRNP
jgi:hypothetical protein